MTIFDRTHSLVKAMRGWDDVRPTNECLHCHGSGRAPGDGKTLCGFCEGTKTRARHKRTAAEGTISHTIGRLNQYDNLGPWYFVEFDDGLRCYVPVSEVQTWDDGWI